MGGDTTPEQPWEQNAGETARAYGAFIAYRDAGPERTIAGTARELGRSAALLYRWSRQHNWIDRAHAWDVTCRREEEATLREARREIVQRQARDADRLQRLAMARLGKLVRRDPETGELALDPEVSVQDAVRVYKLGLDIERALTAEEKPEAESEEGDDDLKRMSDEQLRQLIALAKERAGNDEEEG
jgi:hypothetical protein